ncbi:hypothetical protein KAX97_14885 [candidate division WOR-3 bacterium]|nr:hypothetical protein [candidate division WOR-3 bacterium]
MNEKELNVFTKIYAQTEALHSEIGLLSRKNPNDGVSKFKLQFINRALREANSILTDEQKPFADFSEFDEDSIPTTSDVTLILAQYLGCLEEIRCANIQTDYNKNWFWKTDGGGSKIPTAPPKKIKR